MVAYRTDTYLSHQKVHHEHPHSTEDHLTCRVCTDTARLFNATSQLQLSGVLNVTAIQITVLIHNLYQREEV
jgi:hypothetical protein